MPPAALLIVARRGRRSSGRSSSCSTARHAPAVVVALAIVLVALFALEDAGELDDQLRSVEYQAELTDGLPRVIDEAGGEDHPPRLRPRLHEPVPRPAGRLVPRPPHQRGRPRPEEQRPRVVFHVKHTRRARGRAPGLRPQRGENELAREGDWIVTADCEAAAHDELRRHDPPNRLRDRAAARRTARPPIPRSLTAVGVALLTLVSLVAADAARSTPRSGSTRASPSASRPTTSSTSPACSSRTARRRSTTCCSTSGCRPSATARRRRTCCQRRLRASLTVPAAFWAGAQPVRRPRGLDRRRRWPRINPFLTYYAQETRMYALLALLGAARQRDVPARLRATATAATSRRFAHLAGADDLHPQLGRSSSAMGTVVALAWLLRIEEPRGAPRRSLRDALIGYGVAGARLPAVAADAALPGPPHRRAVGRARPSFDDAARRARRSCSAARPPRSRCCSSRATGSPRWRGRRSRARRGSSRWPSPSASAIAARLAGLADLARVRQPLLRRVRRAAAAARAPPGLAPRGRLGIVCFVLVALFWFDPRVGPAREQEQRPVGRRRASSRSSRRRPRRLDAPRAAPAAGLLPARRRALRRRRWARWTTRASWTGATRWTACGPPSRGRPPAPPSTRSQPGQELVLVQPILRTARWGAPWTSLVRKRSRAVGARARGRPAACGARPSCRSSATTACRKGVRAIVYRRVR